MVAVVFGIFLALWGWIMGRLMENRHPFRYPRRDGFPTIAPHLRSVVVMPWVMLWSGTVIVVIGLILVGIREFA